VVIKAPSQPLHQGRSHRRVTCAVLPRWRGSVGQVHLMPSTGDLFNLPWVYWTETHPP
jgi:hypothetical protein